jgi:uracil phosphoribosyltransferase
MRYFFQHLARGFNNKKLLAKIFISGVGIWNFNIIKKCLICKTDKEELVKLQDKEKKPEYFQTVNIKELLEKYPRLTILQSKPVECLLGQLRDKNLTTSEFRILSRRIMRFIIEEALAGEYDQQGIRESPLGYYKCPVSKIRPSDYIGISILRSGNSMLDELLLILPDINIGKILIQRDESTEEKNPIFFYEKIPENSGNKKILLLDPMLGTGGSAKTAIEVLIKKGIKEENIIFLNLISCEFGIDILFKKFPKIKIITAKVDPELLPIKYLAPGIGDFGDRFYGTVSH